jgi:hypothetical protein
MSHDDHFMFRATVTLIAGGFVLLVALFLLRAVLRTGRRALKEILRVGALMVAMFLTVVVSRGEIGQLGAWAGFGGAAVVTVLSFII